MCKNMNKALKWYKQILKECKQINTQKELKTFQEKTGITFCNDKQKIIQLINDEIFELEN